MSEKRWSALRFEVVLKLAGTFFSSKGVTSLAMPASQGNFKFAKFKFE